MADKQEHVEKITVTLEADQQRADAKAVGLSLLTIEAVVNEARETFKKEMERAGKENEELLVKARPFAKGSLEITLELVVFGAAILLQEYPILLKVREVIKDFFTIKRSLKGSAIHVQEGNILIIENSQVKVDRITLQCLNPSSPASKHCSEAFHSIENDPEIKGVCIKSSAIAEPLIRIRRNEFSYYHPETPIAEEHLGQRVRESRETLQIRQPAFDADLTWRFVWQEKKISAKVRDEAFLKQIGAGLIGFVAGDSLDVDLHRLQEYDPAARTYVDRVYVVPRVRGHNRRSVQRILFEPNTDPQHE